MGACSVKGGSFQSYILIFHATLLSRSEANIVDGWLAVCCLACFAIFSAKSAAETNCPLIFLGYCSVYIMWQKY